MDLIIVCIETDVLNVVLLTGGPAKPAGPGGPPSPRSPYKKREGLKTGATEEDILYMYVSLSIKLQVQFI